VRGLNFLRKTHNDRKAELKEEELVEMMGGMEETDLAQLQPYVEWNAGADRYVVNRLELNKAEGKVWERYTTVRDMSVVEGRKLASREDADKGETDAVSDTLKLKEFLRGRK